jgi:FixJ family two-component response regulator
VHVVRSSPMSMHWRSRITLAKRPYIAVVDDDESVRESLPDLLRELGYDALAFSSAESFLTSDRLRQAECLVLDYAMPGMSGFDLQGELIQRKRKVPIVFITAHGDEMIRLMVRERGAVACLLKPFSDTALLTALQMALKPKSV